MFRWLSFGLTKFHFEGQGNLPLLCATLRSEMMAKNKDGLEAGGDVTWAEIAAVNAKRKAVKAEKRKPKESAKPTVKADS